MLKDYRIIKAVGAAIEEAARNVVRDYSAVEGKEEEVTAQFRGEINRHLLKSIADSLDGEVINGCTFRVATLTKRQEHDVGADLIGIVQLDYGSTRVTKAYLAQSKVGSLHPGPRGQTYATTYSPDMVRQAKDMLDVSPASFVFIYTSEGIACVPAQQVKLAGSNSISTERYPFHSIGAFYEEFIKCFIGDHRIAPGVLDSGNLEDIARATHAQAALLLGVKLKDTRTPHSRARRRSARGQ